MEGRECDRHNVARIGGADGRGGICTVAVVAGSSSGVIKDGTASQRRRRIGATSIVDRCCRVVIERSWVITTTNDTGKHGTDVYSYAIVGAHMIRNANLQCIWSAAAQRSQACKRTQEIVGATGVGRQAETAAGYRNTEVWIGAAAIGKRDQYRIARCPYICTAATCTAAGTAAAARSCEQHQGTSAGMDAYAQVALPVVFQHHLQAYRVPG